MGRDSDFRISSFQEVDAWRILKFKWKTEKYFKSLYSFGGRCHKIRDICMESAKLGQITNQNMAFHMVVSVYRLV